jgi:hypothetical protein
MTGRGYRSTRIFQLNACGYSPYVTSSLTRGWVFRLELLLVLASAVIIGSESQPVGPFPRIYILQEQGGLVITPRHWFLFSSPPTTRRVKVEVFDPASTQDTSLSLHTAY